MTEQQPKVPADVPGPAEVGDAAEVAQVHSAAPSAPSPATSPATPSATPAAPMSPEFAAAVRAVQAMRHEVHKAVVGQPQVVDEVLLAFLCGGHVLIEGVPGLGKTLLVLALAKTFGGNFARIQFTPDLMPSDVTGHAMYDMASGTFRIRKGPAFTNLLLADEINRAPAKTQAALLEVMQEQQITIEGEAIALERPFMALATQNPIEQEGTYPLPEAQLDRFLLKTRIVYPSEAEEVDLVRKVTRGQVGDKLDVEAVDQVVTPEQVLQMQSLAAQVTVDERVGNYAVGLVRTTRVWDGITIGAGPRGGIALIRIARAKALLEGRDHVIPDDIKSMVLPALRHRVALAPELELEGHDIDDVLSSVAEKVEAPRQ